MTGRIVRITRALWYGAMSVAFVVGVPWALVALVGSPLPHQVPDAVQLRDWIDHPFTGTRPWRAASLVVWLVWATVVYLLGAALLRHIGRRRRARLQIRPIEAIAAGIVGATTAVVSTATAHGAQPTTTDAGPPAPSPSTATSHRPAAAAAESEPSYMVQHDDWLSAIAARFLGDRDAYPRLVELNPQLAVRGPNHIEPGWRLRLPADAVDHGIRVHATGPFTPATVTQPASTPAPPTVPAPNPTQPPPSDTSDDSTDEHLDDGDDGDGAPDYEVSHSNGALAGAGLLSALLFAMLMAERRRQRTWLAAGEEPPRPRSGRAERELRAAQQPADVERLDAALRDLNARLAGRPRPDIVGVRLVGGDVHVLLAQAAPDAPAPWLDEGTQWALPAYLEPADVDQQPPLLPLLVTVGSRAGRHLLIDLHRLGTLSITGDPATGRDLLRHLVCELACAAWSTDVTVVLVGFGDEATLIADIAPDRVHAVPTVADVATHLTTALDADPNGRSVVLAAARLDPTTRAILANINTVHGGRVTIVAFAGDIPPIGAATIHASADGPITVDIPGLRLTTDAAYVPVDMLEPMAQVFRVARLTRPADTPDSGHDDVLAVFDPNALEPDLPTPDDRPDAYGAQPSAQDNHRAEDVVGPIATVGRISDEPDPTLDEDLAAWQRADPTRPRLGILGPILIHLPGELTDTRHRFLTELLLYLLTRPNRSASRAEIEDALWYGNPAPAGSLRTSIVRLRRWLGPRDDGLPWIPDGTPGGVYRLTDGVLLDWHLLLRLRERANRRGDAGHTDRQAALTLIRGVPMRDRPETSRYRRPYTWIGDSDINPGRIIATITDLAHQLATYSLEVGDTTTARWAVRQAWLADPDRTYDDLWLDHLHADHQDGQHAAVAQLLHELCEHRGAEVPEDLPPQLYTRLRDFIP